MFYHSGTGILFVQDFCGLAELPARSFFFFFFFFLGGGGGLGGG